MVRLVYFRSYNFARNVKVKRKTFFYEKEKILTGICTANGIDFDLRKKRFTRPI